VRLSGGEGPPPAARDLGELLVRAEGHGSGVTFVSEQEEERFLAWSEVGARARRVAASLEALGLRPGERVALVERTGPAFLDAFFGTLAAGAVPVPLYPPLRLGRMKEYLASTAAMVHAVRARLILASGAVRRLLGEVLASARPELGCLPVDELARGTRKVMKEARPDDLALIQFSSGSTAFPKPVALTHRNVLAQLATLLELLAPTPEDRLVSWLPLYHDMGLTGCLLGALAYPGPLVLIAPEHFLARPAIWLRALSRHRGTISAAPSFAYAYTAERVRDRELEGVDLSRWRAALDGAEPVSAEAVRRFAARFAPQGFRAEALRPVYGLAEATLAVTFTTQGAPFRSQRIDPVALASRGEVLDGRREVVSVGVPVPGVEVELRGQDGESVAERRLGRVFVRGGSVMSGYYGQEEATRNALRQGWLDTGDLGFVRDGELYLYGRAKDVVVVRGANHAPQDLEAPLEEVRGLRRGCAVAVGFEPEGASEELLVLAERRKGAGDDTSLAEAAKKAILEHTGVRAHTVVLLDPGTLPRTSSGKLRRREALRRYLGGELSAPPPARAMTVMLALARSALGYARTRWR